MDVYVALAFQIQTNIKMSLNEFPAIIIHKGHMLLGPAEIQVLNPKTIYFEQMQRLYFILNQTVYYYATTMNLLVVFGED